MLSRGGLSAISSAYANSDSDDEVVPVAVFVNAQKSLLKEGVPTDFANVKIKSEPKDSDDQVIDDVVLLEDYTGESYSAVQVKQEPPSSEDSESDSDESAPSDGDDDELSESGSKKKDKEGPPKAKGEMSFKDLPPIEDLHISVPHDQCKPIGIIKSVVDPLVVVEAFPNIPALDIDSVLFLDMGDRALGKIFDVIGQVQQPFYCVRFNSLEHIESNSVEKGMFVYCAPATPHTTYVFLAQLRKMKGTDASWFDDIEPPAGEQEFSDDEKERASRRKGRKSRGRKLVHRDNPEGSNAQSGQNQNGVEMAEPTGYEPLLVPGFRPSPGYSGQGHRPFGGRRGSGPRHPGFYQHRQTNQNQWQHQQYGQVPYPQSYPSNVYPNPLGPPPGPYPPFNGWARGPPNFYNRDPASFWTPNSHNGSGWGSHPPPPPPPSNP